MWRTDFLWNRMEVLLVFLCHFASVLSWFCNGHGLLLDLHRLLVSCSWKAVCSCSSWGLVGRRRCGLTRLWLLLDPLCSLLLLRWSLCTWISEVCNLFLPLTRHMLLWS